MTTNNPAGLAGVFLDAATGERYDVEYETPAWTASLEWCEFHGIDPKQIPAGSTVVRDDRDHTITYPRVVIGVDGRRVQRDDFSYQVVTVVEQGEAGPLPFPPEVTGAEPAVRALCEDDGQAPPALCSGEAGCAAYEHMLCCPAGADSDDPHDSDDDSDPDDQKDP